VLTLGTGSGSQTYFSFGFIGYGFASIPGFMFTALFAGVYGMTVIGVFIVTSIYLATMRLRKFFLLASLVLLSVGYVGERYWPVTLPERVALVNTELKTQFDAETFTRDKTLTLTSAVEAALKYDPAYVILPEDSRFLHLAYPGLSSMHSYNLFRFTSDHDAVMIDSSRVETGQNKKLYYKEWCFQLRKPRWLILNNI